MGKGDRKTRRGKIIKGSYGVRRPRKKSLKAIKKTATPKKTEIRKQVKKEITVVEEVVVKQKEPKKIVEKERTQAPVKKEIKEKEVKKETSSTEKKQSKTSKVKEGKSADSAKKKSKE